MAASTGAEAAEAESLNSEPMKSRQGNATKGKMSFSMVNDRVLLTFTHSLSVSSDSASSDWIRHPLATDKWWWQIFLGVNKDHVGLWCKYKAEGKKADTETPCFTRAVSYVISKSTDGVLAKGQIPWFSLCTTSCNKWITLPKKIYFAVPRDKTFFVSFSLSILNDKKMVGALLQRSIPKALPSKCVSKDQSIVERLWKSRMGSDLLIETSDGIDIQAHRCFLMGNSPVFAAMFTHDTLEKASGRLKLNDLSHVVVLEMLRFFYFGSVSSLDTDVLTELVIVADRYDVPICKDVCEAILVQNVCSDHKLGLALLPFADKLNLKKLKRESELALMAWDAQNAVQCLHLAVEHSAEMLLRYAAAMAYVCRRCDLSEDPDWKKFEAAHPDVALLLLKEYAVMDFSGAWSIAEARSTEP